MAQKGNNTFFGLETNKPATNPEASFYISIDTANLYVYDSEELPHLVGSSGMTDIFITGGTYNSSASTITFTNNQGDSFDVTDIESGNDIDENNFSRTIYVTSTQLNNCSGCTGTTLEEKIVQYVNNLNYDKQSQDSDIWIEFLDDAGIFTSEFDDTFA